MNDLRTSSPAGIIDGAGHLAGDLACVHCGYNLRTLAIEGSCPECGTGVLRTLHARHLQFSSPRWLQALGLGCALLILIPAVAFGTAFGLSIAGVAHPLTWIIWTAAAMLVAGIYLVTRPDPMLRRFAPGRGWTRPLLFGGTVAWALLAGLIALAEKCEWPVPAKIYETVGQACAGGGFLLLLLLARHLWNIARRGASPLLRRTFQAAFWLVALANVAFGLLIARLHGLGSSGFDWLAALTLLLISFGIGAAALLVLLTSGIVAAARQRALSITE